MTNTSSSNDRNQGAQQQSSDTSKRGFASMDKDKQHEIAAEGGRASHTSGNAHEFDSDEAREGGSKGGQASHGGSQSGSHQGSSQSGSHQGGNQSGSHQSGSQSGDGSNRGFGSMDPDKQRDIAAEGGRAAHASGKAHEFDSDEAREAGKKGGQASHGGHSENR